MGSPVQPQAQQALGPLEVFIDTQLPTRIFVRCHLRDSMSDLQGSLPVCRTVYKTACQQGGFRAAGMLIETWCLQLNLCKSTLTAFQNMAFCAVSDLSVT